MRITQGVHPIQRSKPELIILIRQMLQRYPELEYLLELLSPAASAGEGSYQPQNYPPPSETSI